MTLSDEDDNYFKDGADVEVGTEETFRDSQFVGLVWSQLGLILFTTCCGSVKEVSLVKALNFRAFGNVFID